MVSMALINITLNGEPREIPTAVDLPTLLEIFSLPSQRIAVELNGSVLRRVDWPKTQVIDGDRVEVVHFVGGG